MICENCGMDTGRRGHVVPWDCNTAMKKRLRELQNRCDMLTEQLAQAKADSAARRDKQAAPSA
jgi:hypothetical protein